MRWLDLGDAQILELERGEDIDLVNTGLRQDDDFTRILEQVKHLADPITLKAAACIEAIANALESRAGNPDVSLRFRFCTNARPTIERPSPFRPRRAGIAVWMMLRAGLERSEQGSLANLRTILKTARQPNACSDATWSRYQQFIKAADDVDFLKLITAFEWGTGAGESDELEPFIVQRLFSSGFVATSNDAARVYRLLFVFVIKRLSLAGPKRLSRNDLLEQVATQEPSAEDIFLLRQIEDRVFSLEQRVSAIEGVVTLHGDLILELVASQQQISQQRIEEGIDVADIEVPPPLDRSSPRKTVVGELVAEIREVSWLALHGSVGTGKTELAKLIALAGGFGRSTFISLRDRSAAAAEFYVLQALATIAHASRSQDRAHLLREVISELQLDGLIVLDDLPPLVPGDRLSRLLIDLCRACRNSGVHLLTTSHYAPPDGVIDQLSKADHVVFMLPPLNETEVMELFTAWDMPAAAPVVSTVKEAVAWTEGNPTLLTALARRLARDGWSADRAEIEQLLQFQPVIEFRQDIVRRLISTVEDLTDRRLLYRLCLIQGTFVLDSAIAIAATHEPLDRPQERMLNLAGPWLQRLGPSRFLTSPLIRPLAMTELPLNERRCVWNDLASEIMGRRRKSVLDVATAIRYLTSAEEYDRVSAFLIVAFNAARKLPEDQLRFLLSASWLDTPLPHQMKRSDRIYLRSFQILACDRVGIPTQQLFFEADGLIQSAAASDAWAIAAYVAQTLRLRAVVDFVSAMRDLRLVITIFPRLSESEGPLAKLPPELKVATLLWFVVTEIRTAQHLGLWLDALELFSSDDLLAAFDGETEADQLGCQIATDQVWLNEFLKPSVERDWASVERVLHRAEELGHKNALQSLILAAGRSRIVVLAGYLKSLPAAVKAANRILSKDHSPLSVLLISEALGRQYFIQKDFESAAKWMRQAADANTDSFPHIKIHARVFLSAAIADTAPAEALNLVEQSFSTIRDSRKPIRPLSRVEAAGELAIARWLAGDLPGSFRAYDTATEDLLACRDDSGEWRSMFVMLAHAGGYFSRSAAGIDSPDTVEGAAYAPPYRAMLVTAHTDDRASLFSAEREAMLAPLMSMFAESAGDDDRAGHWALRGIDDSRARGNVAGVSVLGWQLAAQLIRQRRFVDALDVAREAAAATAVQRIFHDRGRALPVFGVDISEVLRDANDEQRLHVDRMAVDWVGTAVAFGLALLDLQDRRLAAEQAAVVIEFCRSAALDAANSSVWIGFAEILSASYMTAESYQELNRRVKGAVHSGENIFHVVGYLAMSLHPESSLKSAAILHVTIMPYVERLLSGMSSFYRLAITPFIVHYWQNAIERQPFYFTAPQRVRESLDAALLVPERTRAKAILKAVIDGLNVHLSEEAAEAKRWVQG